MTKEKRLFFLLSGKMIDSHFCMFDQNRNFNLVFVRQYDMHIISWAIVLCRSRNKKA